MHNRYDHQEIAKRIRELAHRINSLGLLRLNKQKNLQEKAYARCDFDDDVLDNEFESVDYKPRRTNR